MCLSNVRVPTISQMALHNVTPSGLSSKIHRRRYTRAASVFNNHVDEKTPRIMKEIKKISYIIGLTKPREVQYHVL